MELARPNHGYLYILLFRVHFADWVCLTHSQWMFVLPINLGHDSSWMPCRTWPPLPDAASLANANQGKDQGGRSIGLAYYLESKSHLGLFDMFALSPDMFPRVACLSCLMLCLSPEGNSAVAAATPYVLYMVPHRGWYKLCPVTCHSRFPKGPLPCPFKAPVGDVVQHSQVPFST